MRYSKRARSLVIGLMSLGILASGAAWAATRTWTDATGKHTMEAELVEATAEHVMLKSDGATKKVPLKKLSAADQKFVADHLAALSADAAPKSDEATTKKAGATSDSAADRIAARKAAETFLDKLQDEDRNVVSDLLTAAAKERLTAGSSPVTTIPKPDTARSVRVGKATIKDDEATVSAKLRAGGTNQEVKVFLRREEAAWKIRGVAATPSGGAEQTIDFEEGSAAMLAGGGVGEPGAVGPPADELIPPEGDAQELIKFMQGLGKDPRTAQDREFRQRALVAMLDAADKVFDLDDSTKTQLITAATHKLQAVGMLVGSDVKDLNERAESLAKQVKQHELEELARPVEALTLRLELQTSKTPAAIAAALKKVKSFLANENIDDVSVGLANAAAKVAEQMQYRGMKPADVAAAIESLAAPLVASDHAQAFALGNQLMGKARRLGLVGKPMELKGLTWDGKPLDMGQFEGKVVLVDFWATWCGPCIEEMPNIRANYDKYHEQGFDVIAISLDRKIDALREYVEREQVPWTVLADYHEGLSPADRMASYYGISGIPSTVLIGRDGKVVALNVRGEQLDKQLEKLMGSGG